MKWIFAILVVFLMFGLVDVVPADANEPHWSPVVKKYYPYWRSHYWVDRELWGNRGYIIGGPPRTLAGDTGVGAPDVEVAMEETVIIKEEPMDVKPRQIKEKPTTHVVKKGECLWYIAGYEEIYGNPLKWPLIYKANKDKIKDPDLIYPGQVFVIPRD